MVVIRKNKQLKKNIKQNLKFYQNPEQEAEERTRDMMAHITMGFLTVASVLFCILASINIVFRVPDFYRFEFDRTGILSKLDIGISGTDMGSMFSKFMLHQTDNFNVEAEYEGINREIFNQTEGATMGNFRVLLGVLLIITVISLIITVACIVILHIKSLARSLRVALNIALGVYIAAIAGIAVYFNVFNGDIALKNSMTVGKFAADDLLQQMFDGRFTLDATVIVLAISFILMMIIRYIIWKLTAQKGIFSKGLKGAAK